MCVFSLHLYFKLQTFPVTKNSFSTQQMHADRMNYTFMLHKLSFYNSKSRLLHDYLV